MLLAKSTFMQKRGETATSTVGRFPLFLASVQYKNGVKSFINSLISVLAHLCMVFWMNFKNKLNHSHVTHGFLV